MKKIIAIIVAVLGALVLGFVIYAAMQPAEYGLKRKVSIAASADKIYPYIVNLKKRSNWSPWEMRDETMQTTYNEIEEGVGAKSSWTSENSGSGSMLVTKVTPYEMVEVDLDFGEMGKAKAYWELEENDSGTIVTWGFSGKAEGLIGKFFGSMMDGMLGPDYEEGLNNLKELVENNE